MRSNGLVNLLTGILVCVSQAIHAATEISPGVLYQPGTKLKVSTIGLELAVPSGWQAILPQGSEALIMEPVDKVARMIISAVPQSNDQQVKQTMSDQLVLDFQSQLLPRGEVMKKAGLYSQTYEVTGSNPQDLVGSAYGRLADSGLAVYVVMLEPAKQNMVPPVGKKLIEDMSFPAPQVLHAMSDSKGQADAAGNIDWNNTLRGRTLKYMNTGGGLSVTRKMNLCSDGSFSYSDSDSYASSDAMTDFSAYSSGGQRGTWKITGDKLMLQWNDGSSSQYTLSRRYVPEWSEWGTFVDEQRWFNVQNQVCQ